MKRLFKLLLVLGAVAWAVALLAQADLPSSWASFCRVTSPGQRGFLVALFLLPSLVTACLDTYGWRASFGAERPPTPFPRLFAIRLAGESVNQATPLLSLGGEAVKASLAANEQISVRSSATSVMAGRLLMTLMQVLYVGIGLATLLPRFAQQQGLLVAFGAFPFLLGIVLLGLFIARYAVPPSVRQRLTGGRFAGRLAPAREIIARVLGFWREHPRECAAASLCFLAGWAAIAAEFWIVARVLGVPLSTTEALGLEALMNSVTMATFFIPGNMGSQEAGLLLLARLFGLAPPFGVLMAILRRGRELFWVALGFGSLAVLGGPSAEAGKRPVQTQTLAEAGDAACR